MSDNELATLTKMGAKEQIFNAEYKDGQLQIVEVTPFDKSEGLPDLSGDGEQKQYMQVIDTDKGLVHLDLVNLTLVRCEDGQESFQLVSNADTSEGSGEASDTAVTCVLQTSDNEEHENSEYVIVDGENGQGPLFFLQSSLQQVNTQEEKEEVQITKAPSPAELIEKAKALQKVKAIITQTRKRGRKRKSELPPPHELLASPNFKLYLYSCKQCTFKCNAIKEMSAHKAEVHGGGRARGPGRSSSVSLQCARCPYRGLTHTQLMRHVQLKHVENKDDEHEHDDSSCEISTIDKVCLSGRQFDDADVLVCGACGFESSSRPTFKLHIEQEHGLSTY